MLSDASVVFRKARIIASVARLNSINVQQRKLLASPCDNNTIVSAQILVKSIHFVVVTPPNGYRQVSFRDDARGGHGFVEVHFLVVAERERRDLWQH